MNLLDQDRPGRATSTLNARFVERGKAERSKNLQGFVLLAHFIFQPGNHAGNGNAQLFQHNRFGFRRVVFHLFPDSAQQL